MGVTPVKTNSSSSPTVNININVSSPEQAAEVTRKIYAFDHSKTEEKILASVGFFIDHSKIDERVRAYDAALNSGPAQAGDERPLFRGQIKTGYIFDIDGVLTDYRHRVHFIRGLDANNTAEIEKQFPDAVLTRYGKAVLSSGVKQFLTSMGYRRGKDGLWRDWIGFYARMVGDLPIKNNIDMLNTLAKDNQIVLITGRPERHRKDTVSWLNTFKVKFDLLVMRPEKNFKKNADLKYELYMDMIAPLRYLGVFDDNPDAVAMYRRCGLNVFQVEDKTA